MIILASALVKPVPIPTNTTKVTKRNNFTGRRGGAAAIN